MTSAPTKSPLSPKIRRLAKKLAKRERQLDSLKRKLQRARDKDHARQNGKPEASPSSLVVASA